MDREADVGAGGRRIRLGWLSRIVFTYGAIWLFGRAVWLLIALATYITQLGPSEFRHVAGPSLLGCALGVTLVLAALTAPVWPLILVSPLMATEQRRAVWHRERQDFVRRFYRWLWSPVLRFERWRVRRRELWRIASETPIPPEERGRRGAELRRRAWRTLGLWAGVALLVAIDAIVTYRTSRSAVFIPGWLYVEVAVTLLLGGSAAANRLLALAAYRRDMPGAQEGMRGGTD